MWRSGAGCTYEIDHNRRRMSEITNLIESIFADDCQGLMGVVLVSAEGKENAPAVADAPLSEDLFGAQIFTIERDRAQAADGICRRAAIGQPVFERRPGTANGAKMSQPQVTD